MGLKSNESPSRTVKDIHTHREDDHVKTEAQIEAMSQVRPEVPSGKRLGRIPLLEPLKGAGPC